MVIKGIVHNGQIEIDCSSLAEGTQVLVYPLVTPSMKVSQEHDLNGLKAEVNRIAFLTCENHSDEEFSGADHDSVLYGN